MPTPFELAADLIKNADGILLTAGAGMGVDSGLPDFRGDTGFWNAYPALADCRITFSSIANPAAFRRDPKQAWGFYGHRLALYRKTQPHAGFAMLQAMAAQMPHGAFVVTSNVDGQFQKAGFDVSRILEIHGSIHELQCCEPCCESVWSAAALTPHTDDAQCLWLGELPRCRFCGGLARPNIVMFEDDRWVPERQSVQREHWRQWKAAVRRMVVIECGAGVEIVSIRRFSEAQGCPVIRINPRHPELRAGQGVSLPGGAEESLRLIAKALKG